jgi:hypothetical protein
LQESSVGQSRAPVAGSTRTRPTLEKFEWESRIHGHLKSQIAWRRRRELFLKPFSCEFFSFSFLRCLPVWLTLENIFEGLSINPQLKQNTHKHNCKICRILDQFGHLEPRGGALILLAFAFSLLLSL